MKKYKAAQPTRQIFDPYNCSSTGHQTSESPWKPAAFLRGRSVQLNDQLRQTALAKNHKDDASLPEDVPVAKEVRQKNIYESMGVKKPRSPSPTKEKRIHFIEAARKGHLIDLQMAALEGGPPVPEPSLPAPKGMFSGLTIHVSGTTVPLISDHSLRSLLVEHGAVVSPSVLRKQVTHVIVAPKSRGGGALAASKQQKEMRVRNNRLKFVTAEWATESVTAGKRLSESLFQPEGLRTSNGNVFSSFAIKKPGDQKKSK